MDVFFNEALLENIHDSESSLDIHCNSGFATIPKVGNFPLSSFLVSPKRVLQSFYYLSEKRKNIKTLDSLERNQFVVHKGDGSDQGFA